MDFDHQEARKPQRENIGRQLAKLGTTIFEAETIDISENADRYFIPSSLLAELRRSAIDDLKEKMQKSAFWKAQTDTSHYKETSSGKDISLTWQPEYSQFPYLYNISNQEAVRFYEEEGGKDIRQAFEIKEPKEPLVMQCRHCLRYSLGYCVRRGGKRPQWHEPLSLQLPDGRRFRLEFKCDECQMNIYAE